MFRISYILSKSRNLNIQYLSAKCEYNSRIVRTLSTKSLNSFLRRPPSEHYEKSFNNEEQDKVTPYGWIMLLIPLTTFGLGCWQVQRKKWKESLIADLAAKTSIPPIEFPNEITELDELEYQAVKLRGKFLHEREITMGPRSLIQKNNENKGGLFTVQDSSIGYLIITPFVLEDRDHVVLINRGWVPRNNINPKTRQSGQIEGTVDLVGVVRLPENRPQFSPKNTSTTNYLYRDMQQMCAVTGAEPYYLDATESSTVSGGPIGGQTRVTLRNEHLSYIITWFSLSAFTSYLWHRQIWRRIPY